jgi:hypothetical protein
LNVHHLRVVALSVALAAATTGLSASDSPAQAFARTWEGKSVTVTQTLYTLVYNERNRAGVTKGGRKDGLTVVTPFEGVHFQFDGRQGKDDVTERDVRRVIKGVTETYQADSLDVRPYQKIEPLLLTRYDAGANLVVKNVRVDRNSVRLGFVQMDGPDAADEVTSLTIRWPTPLSKTFSERMLVENLIHSFVDVRSAP